MHYELLPSGNNTLLILGPGIETNDCHLFLLVFSIND